MAGGVVWLVEGDGLSGKEKDSGVHLLMITSMGCGYVGLLRLLRFSREGIIGFGYMDEVWDGAEM